MPALIRRKTSEKTRLLNDMIVTYRRISLSGDLDPAHHIKPPLPSPAILQMTAPTKQWQSWNEDTEFEAEYGITSNEKSGWSPEWVAILVSTSKRDPHTGRKIVAYKAVPNCEVHKYMRGRARVRVMDFGRQRY